MKRNHHVTVKMEELSSSEEIETAGPRLLLKRTQESNVRDPPSKEIALNKPCVTIGRSIQVDCCILSDSISRQHCEIKHEQPDKWVVVDKSSNGVFVNGVRTKQLIGHTLNDGDLIQLAHADEPIAEYEFKANAVHKLPKDTVVRPKRLKPEVSLPVPVPAPVQPTLPQNNTATTSTPALGENLTPERLELQMRNESLLGKIEKMEAVMHQREHDLRQQWEREQELKTKAEEAKVETLKKEIEELRREEWQKQLADLHAQHKSALEEKVNLSVMLESMQGDKFKEREAEKQKEQLEVELKKKDDACSALLQRLQEVTAKNEASEAAAIRLRDELMKNVSETMEMELQCSICSELFVKAATLNCAHSYCSYCINEWKRKKADCPICRKPIISITPSLVLDSFIDKIVESLDASLRERRKELLEERKKIKTQSTANTGAVYITINHHPAIVAVRRGASSRSRGRGGHQSGGSRRSQQGRGGAAAAQHPPTIPVPALALLPTNPPRLHPPPIPVPPPPQPPPLSAISRPIVISSSSDTSSGSEDDYGAYYGGYGTCYRCGRSGHWANGCPF